MDENIDAGQMNRRFLHLWLVVSLGPPGLPGIGPREMEGGGPTPPAPGQRAPEAAPDRAGSSLRARGRRD